MCAAFLPLHHALRDRRQVAIDVEARSPSGGEADTIGASQSAALEDSPHSSIPQHSCIAVKIWDGTPTLNAVVRNGSLSSTNTVPMIGLTPIRG